MRTTISIVGIVMLLAVAAGGQNASQSRPGDASPATARVGTMSELMIHIIYPTSDAVFYVSSRTPTTDAEWAALQASTLTLAESANLLMMPGRTRPGPWNADSRLMLDAAWGAFKAAKAKNLEGVEAVSDQLYESCVSCHKAYRPDYGKPKPPPSGR
jgi:cytochrome c556